MLLNKYLAVFLEFFSSILIAKNLGVYDYGRYTVLYLIPCLIGSLASFGLGPSIIYHINKKKTQVGAIFYSYGLLGTLLGSFFSVFLIVISKYILLESFYNSQIDLKQIAFSSIIIPLLILQKYFKAIVRAQYKILSFTIIMDFLPSLIRIMGIIYIFKIINGGFQEIIYMPIILNMTITLILAINVFLGILRSRRENKIFLSFNEIASIYNFGLKSFLGSLIQKTNDQVITIFAVPFLGMEMMGIFSLGSKFTTILNSFTASISVVYVPKVSKTDINHIKSLIIKIIPQLIYLLLLIVFLSFLFLPIIINLFYGNQFIQSFWIFAILSPGLIALSITRISNTSFTQSGRPFIKSITRLIGMIVNLSIMFFLIKQFSVYGLALSISISYFFMMFISLIYLNKLFAINPIEVFKFDFFIFKKSFDKLKIRFYK